MSSQPKRAVSVIDLDDSPTPPPSGRVQDDRDRDDKLALPVRGKEYLLQKVDELEQAMRDHLIAAGLVLRHHADINKMGGVAGRGPVRAPRHLLDELERTKEEYAWTRAELQEYMHLILTAPPESPLPTPAPLPAPTKASRPTLLPSAFPPVVGSSPLAQPTQLAPKPVQQAAAAPAPARPTAPRPGTGQPPSSQPILPRPPQLAQPPSFQLTPQQVSSPADTSSPQTNPTKPRPKPKPRLAPGVIADATKGGLASMQGVNPANLPAGATNRVGGAQQPGMAGGLPINMQQFANMNLTPQQRQQLQQHQQNQLHQQQLQQQYNNTLRNPSSSANSLQQQQQQQQQRPPANQLRPTSSASHLIVDDSTLAAMGLDATTFAGGNLNSSHIDKLTSDQARVLMEQLNRQKAAGGQVVAGGGPAGQAGLAKQLQQKLTGGGGGGGGPGQQQQQQQQRPRMPAQVQTRPPQVVQPAPPPPPPPPAPAPVVEQPAAAVDPLALPDFSDLDLSGIDFAAMGDLLAEPEGGWDAFAAGLEGGGA